MLEGNCKLECFVIVGCPEVTSSFVEECFGVHIIDIRNDYPRATHGKKAFMCTDESVEVRFSQRKNIS